MACYCRAMAASNGLPFQVSLESQKLCAPYKVTTTPQLGSLGITIGLAAVTASVNTLLIVMADILGAWELHYSQTGTQVRRMIPAVTRTASARSPSDSADQQQPVWDCRSALSGPMVLVLRVQLEDWTSMPADGSGAVRMQRGSS